MGIKKQKNGKWQVSYHKRHPITKRPITRIAKDLPSESAAKKELAKLIVKVEKVISSQGIPKWEELLAEFELTGESTGLNHNTLSNYLICLRGHTLPAWEGRPTNQITGMEIRDLIIEKVGNKSIDHQRSMLKFFRAVFQYAFEAGYVQQNPAPQIKFKKREKLQQVLTRAQIQQLLEQAKIMDSEWYPIWSMALYTGMRNGELYALTWEKIDLESRQIRVDSSWNSKVGFKSTKSGEGRYLEIAKPLLAILRDLKIGAIDEFVLPRIPKWTKGEQARELRAFLQGMGLPRVRFHDLRATWATVMLTEGVEPIKVMKMGGWKDLKTMQYYIRKAGVDIKGITDRLDLHDPYVSTPKILPFNEQCSTL